MRNVLLMLILGYGVLYQQPYFVSTNLVRQDPRVVALERYLTAKKSPLATTAASFVEIADAYKLDWRLLPAIAGVESTFETRGNTTDYNPFGYMCGAHPCRFNSFEYAIERVAKTISRSRTYARFQQNKSTFALAQVYNHVQPKDWATKVDYFMREIYDSY